MVSGEFQCGDAVVWRKASMLVGRRREEVNKE